VNDSGATAIGLTLIDSVQLPVRISLGVRKRIQMVIGSIILMGGGILGVKEHPLLGYVCAVFFGVTAVANWLAYALKRDYLELSKDGLRVSSFLAPYFVSWSEIESFVVVDMVSSQFVGWNYSPGFKKYPLRRRLGRFLVGAERNLPYCGGGAEEIARLLNQFREKHSMRPAF
jgi:hypothetical protein